MDVEQLQFDLVTGNSIEVIADLRIAPKTIGDIMELGLNKHNGRLTTMMFGKEQLNKLDEEGTLDIDNTFKDLSDLETIWMFTILDIRFKAEFFSSVTYFLNLDDDESKSLMFGLDGKEISYINSDKEEVKIDSTVFKKIKDVVGYQNASKGLNVEDVEKEMNMSDAARKIYDKIQKNREKVDEIKKQEAPENTLADIVSSVTISSPSINKTNIKELTLFQLFDEYQRILRKEGYGIGIQAMLVGSKEDVQHWTENMYK